LLFPIHELGAHPGLESVQDATLWHGTAVQVELAYAADAAVQPSRNPAIRFQQHRNITAHHSAYLLSLASNSEQASAALEVEVADGCHDGHAEGHHKASHDASAGPNKGALKAEPVCKAAAVAAGMVSPTIILPMISYRGVNTWA
jgi:hypothetical protein